MATVAAVWAPFASGSKVPASAKTPAVLKAVWQGVPEKHPIRANVWRLAREQDALPPVRGLPKASRQVEEKVGMELNSEGCFAFVGGADAPAVEKLLMAHAQRGALDDYMPGSVQLAALLLQEFHNDSAEALSTLLALTAKISTYFAHSHVHLRRDCLVLADLIVSHLKPLADHLNSVQFDVIDLTDLVCVWAAPIFVYAFPKPFVLRMLDLVLLHGPAVILPVMFGFFSHFAGDLSVLHSSDAVFDFLATVPPSLSSRDLDSIFRAAEQLASQSDLLAKMRAENDWIATVDHTGIPTFVPGFFNEPVVNPVPGTVDVKALSARYESSSGASDSATRGLGKPSKGPADGVDPAGEAVVGYDGDLAAQLAAAENRLKNQATKIANLEKQILVLEGKMSSQSTKSPLRPAMSSAASSAVVRELQLRQENTADVEDELAKVAIHVESGAGSDRYRSLSFSQMNEVFSKVHTLLEFPCIYIEGYLLKLSRGGLFGRQVLNQRWFVLKGRFLTYFKTADQTKPQKDRCISLRGSTVSAVDEHPKGQFAFSIHTNKEHYLLFATSAEERERWVDALRSAVKT
ncbi:PH domain-containing protein [Plasmodiophora brassicae]|uniref:PH domain-containing protein n=2 Tax=Plasmodiophora brassicae TaxID=37360 RepID=A0A3P3XYK4_PLABS|nr:unnamed protein product [Plasmodiophora brassicae]